MGGVENLTGGLPLSTRITVGLSWTVIIATIDIAYLSILMDLLNLLLALLKK